MTPLMTCSRCTQPLPPTAAFCRRCGLAVRRPAAAVNRALVPGRRRSLATPLGITAGVAALTLLLVAGSFVRLSPRPVAVPQTAVVPATPPSSDVQQLPPPPTVYTSPVPSRYGPSVTLPPGYREEPARRDERYHEHR